MGTDPRRGQEAGQALLEYLLLVFISVTIILGVVYQFNVSFRNFAQAYFVGEESYLGCLIKEGILPGDQSEDGECTVPKFDFSNMKKLQVANAQGSPPYSPNGSSSNSGKNGAGDLSKQSSNASPAARASEGGGRGLVPVNKGDGKLYASAKTNGGGLTKQKAGDYTGSNGFSSATTRGDGSGSSKSADGGSGLIQTREYGSDPTRDKGKAGNVPTNERDLKTAREIAAEKEKKKKALEEIQASFTLGNILRLIIILALLFSVIFFLGSSIVAASRGNRKRNG